MAPPSLVPWGLAAFILPLCTNVFVTGLIAWRIWYLSPRKASDLRGAHFPLGSGQAAMGIVIESGVLYLAVQVVLVTLFAIGHPAQGIVAVIAVQIYVRNRRLSRTTKLNILCIQGIAPTLIVIRVALGLSNTPSGRLSSEATSSSQPVPVHTRVQVGYTMASYTDSSSTQPNFPEIHLDQIKSKTGGEYLPSNYSSATVKDVV